MSGGKGRSTENIIPSLDQRKGARTVGSRYSEYHGLDSEGSRRQSYNNIILPFYRNLTGRNSV